eukprot:s1278_g11.t1
MLWHQPIQDMVAAGVALRRGNPELLLLSESPSACLSREEHPAFAAGISGCLFAAEPRDQLDTLPPTVPSMPSLRRRGTALLLAAAFAVAAVFRNGSSAFSGCGCEGRHVAVQIRAVKAEAPVTEAPRGETTPSSREEQLLREVTSNTPGLARSTSPKEGQEDGGIRLLFPPEPHESVTFALWFGPLPCFQVGTFRYCFCLSQTMVLTGFLLALAVAIMGPEILMAPKRYGGP